MRPTKEEVNASLAEVRTLIARCSPDLADRIQLSGPRLTCAVIDLEVAFRHEPHLSSEALESTRRANPADLKDQSTADKELQAEFARALQQLSAHEHEAAGLFNLKRLSDAPPNQRTRTFREVCTLCAGKRHTPCQKCKGQGGRTCQSCEGRRERDCADCYATGRTRAANGEDVTCPYCSGTRRRPCLTCSKAGRVLCPTCRGKRVSACKPCSATGVRRFARKLSITSSASAKVNASTVPHEQLNQIFSAFGGLENLDATTGSLKVLTHAPGRVVYQLAVPVVTVRVNGPHGPGGCVVAGLTPRIVDAGDFIERGLRDQMLELRRILESGSALTCDHVLLRSRVLTILDVPSHRACLLGQVANVPGLSSDYVNQCRSLVTAAIRQIKDNVMFRYIVSGCLLGPLSYLVAHRLAGMPPSAALPYGLLPPAIAYCGAVLSFGLTMRSVAPDTALRDALRKTLSFP